MITAPDAPSCSDTVTKGDDFASLDDRIESAIENSKDSGYHSHGRLLSALATGMDDMITEREVRTPLEIAKIAISKM